MQIGDDANRVPKKLWDGLHPNWTEPPIDDATFVITIYIAVSKFGLARGVELESVFDGMEPVLNGAGATLSDPRLACIQRRG
ncbi:MAG: hypothetical protein GY761_02420 [Hyphomicrobiales bacterium]|nr:hypothetical protein [Hyphomicrobiales bacterium]